MLNVPSSMKNLFSSSVCFLISEIDAADENMQFSNLSVTITSLKNDTSSLFSLRKPAEVNFLNVSSCSDNLKISKPLVGAFPYLAHRMFDKVFFNSSKTLGYFSCPQIGSFFHLQFF